jgi:hypothetical protein
MNVAWISGRAGSAVVDTGTETFLLIEGDDAPPVACSPRHLNVQCSTYDDVVREEAGAFPFARTREALRLAVAICCWQTLESMTACCECFAVLRCHSEPICLEESSWRPTERRRKWCFCWQRSTTTLR